MGRVIRYSDELKEEAVNQIFVHGYPVKGVTRRLGITNKGSRAVEIARCANQ
ncbi:MAG: transposase [Halioglobus sp.]